MDRKSSIYNIYNYILQTLQKQIWLIYGKVQNGNRIMCINAEKSKTYMLKYSLLK